MEVAEMNILEAKEAVIRVAPNCTVFVHATVVYYDHSEQDVVDFRISVLPGWTGVSCDVESGPTLNGVVEAVLAHYPFSPGATRPEIVEATACIT
jgi:hypothetical protein